MSLRIPGLFLQVQPGGERWLGFAKNKRAQLRRTIKKGRRNNQSKVYNMSDGSKVFVSVSNVGRDTIRITSGVAADTSLYVVESPPFDSALFSRYLGPSNQAITDFGVGTDASSSNVTAVNVSGAVESVSFVAKADPGERSVADKISEALRILSRSYHFVDQYYIAHLADTFGTGHLIDSVGVLEITIGAFESTIVKYVAADSEANPPVTEKVFFAPRTTTQAFPNIDGYHVFNLAEYLTLTSTIEASRDTLTTFVADDPEDDPLEMTVDFSHTEFGITFETSFTIGEAESISVPSISEAVPNPDDSLRLDFSFVSTSSNPGSVRIIFSLTYVRPDVDLGFPFGLVPDVTLDVRDLSPAISDTLLLEESGDPEENLVYVDSRHGGVVTREGPTFSSNDLPNFETEVIQEEGTYNGSLETSKAYVPGFDFYIDDDGLFTTDTHESVLDTTITKTEITNLANNPTYVPTSGTSSVTASINFSSSFNGSALIPYNGEQVIDKRQIQGTRSATPATVTRPQTSGLAEPDTIIEFYQPPHDAGHIVYEGSFSPGSSSSSLTGIITSTFAMNGVNYGIETDTSEADSAVATLFVNDVAVAVTLDDTTGSAVASVNDSTGLEFDTNLSKSYTYVEDVVNTVTHDVPTQAQWTDVLGNDINDYVPTTSTETFFTDVSNFKMNHTGTEAAAASDATLTQDTTISFLSSANGFTYSFTMELTGGLTRDFTEDNLQVIASRANLTVENASTGTRDVFGLSGTPFSSIQFTDQVNFVVKMQYRDLNVNVGSTASRVSLGDEPFDQTVSKLTASFFDVETRSSLSRTRQIPSDFIVNQSAWSQFPIGLSSTANKTGSITILWPGMPGGVDGVCVFRSTGLRTAYQSAFDAYWADPTDGNLTTLRSQREVLLNNFASDELMDILEPSPFSIPITYVILA